VARGSQAIRCVKAFDLLPVRHRAVSVCAPLDDVLAGLRAPRKHLPCRLLYDAAGAELFEQITRLDAYYPTRIELALLDDHLAQIAEHVGRAARVIEPGSGAALKTRKLLAALDRPSMYIPIDVAYEQMHDDRLLLLGADATRDPAALIRAYDDEDGVTAAFDKNVLRHLNRTCGATFDLDAFEHRAIWNAAASRVEMHLVSTRRQIIEIGGATIRFVPGEPIVTEHCYKHTPDALHALLAMAGWTPRQIFTSPVRPYRLWLCEAKRGALR
jgi:uncharacterized SAM-dependent methyltransferase